MADLLFALITAAFFALCVAYVSLVDRIVGPDPTGATLEEAAPEPLVVRR